MGCVGCSGLRFGRGCVSVWCCGVCEGGAGGVSVGEAVADVWGGVVPVLVWCGSCSTCLRLFVVVVWLVFVGGLGGIATIGAALRRVVGVSGLYGRKTPRVVAWKGQRRVPVEGSMVLNLPCGCSKCSPPRWYAGDMGFLGCSGRRFGRGCVSVWCCGVCEGGAGGVSVGEAVADVWGGVVPVLVWLVFVGGLGGIATIGAALRRVAGVSGVYGRKTPRAVACKGQRRVPGLPLVGLTCAVERLEARAAT